MTGLGERVAEGINKIVLSYLEKSSTNYQPFSAPRPGLLLRCLQPGDVLLIEGNTRLSGIIKYLTQSTWSHAALYVGRQKFVDTEKTGPGKTSKIGGEAVDEDASVPRPALLEALADRGVILSSLSKYDRFNTRICRPVGLSEADRQKVVDYALKNLGKQYDSNHIVDLLRYLFPYPPVPMSWRRRMLAIGSGDPTRAICSTLIAEAFYSVSYPILPAPLFNDAADDTSMRTTRYVDREILHIKKSGLYTPRDFDVSPYFDVIKPILQAHFDYHRLILRQD